MLLRVFSFLIALFFCISCNYFSPNKNSTVPQLDSIVYFSSVDTPPSFKVCDSLIKKEAQNHCFRTTLHKRIGERLATHTIKVKSAVEDTIVVKLQVNNLGEINFIGTKSSEIIQEQLPNLDSILKLTITGLPKIYPAIKRGIPVTVEYQLPVRISLGFR